MPQANAGLAIACALGVTFPFNLILGIPLYGLYEAGIIVAWLIERGRTKRDAAEAKAEEEEARREAAEEESRRRAAAQAAPSGTVPAGE